MGKIYVPDTADHTADAVVIGGGIVGVATAFWLSKAGLKTILVEIRDGLSTLTTAASIESFRAQFTEPAMAALARESIEVWENFAEVIGIPDYQINLRHGGYLFISQDENKFAEIEKTVEGYHAVGVVDSEFWNGDDVRAHYPWVSNKVIAGAFRAKDGWFSAHEATQGLAKASQQGQFFLETEAQDILVDAQGVSAVVTNRGTISTRTVVNTAGPFAIQIAAMVGVELPVFQVRRQRVFVAPHPRIPQDAPLTIDVDNDSYWRPETGGALMGWHDPQESRSEPMRKPLGDYEFPAYTFDKVGALSPFWYEIMGDFKRPDLIVHAGQYVHSPDDQPIIGPVETVPGFFVNCAYWPGVMLSPAAGRWTADLITGRMKPEENPLRLSRFEEGVSVAPGALLRGRH
jgi:sarcosine oxidase subunit beta